MNEKYYTVEQISELLSMHPKTIQRYIREGKLQASKFGKSWRVTGHDLSRFTEDHGASSSERPADVVSQPRVIASSVIDIAVISKDDANRMINTLTAALNIKPPEFGQASMHAQFLEADHCVRITLWGNLAFMSAILSTIEAFMGHFEEDL